MKFRLVLILTGLAACAVGLTGQAPPRFEEKVEVRLIDLEVHVTDDQGNRVGGLTADDFVIIEDGVEQEITNFTEVTKTSLVGSAGITVMKERPGAVDVGRPPRTLVLFIDYLPLTPPERRELFTRLRDFAHEALEPGDRAMVVHWKNPAEVLVELTTDLSQVNDALVELAETSVPPEQTYGLDAQEQFLQEAQAFEEEILNSGPSLPGQPPQERITIPDSDPSSAVSQMEVSLRACARRYQAEMDWKTSAMKNLISSLSGMEGRKLFVYVASRFPANAATYCQASRRAGTLQRDLPQFENRRFIESVIKSANAGGVVFYGFRPIISRTSGGADQKFVAEEGRSEGANEQLELLNDSRALRDLAEDTGGLMATGAGIFEALPRVIDDLESYYSIAYRTRHEGSDTEHRIEVRVPEKDVRVRTRRSLVEKSRESEAKDWLVANLFAASRAGELDVELVTGEPRREGRRTFLPVELRIPLDQLTYEGDPPTAQFTVMTAAGSSLGVISDVHEDTREVRRPDAGEGISPYATYELEMLVDEREQHVSLGVLDNRSGLTSYHVIDQTGASLLDRESLQPSWTEWRALLDRLRMAERPMMVYFRPADCTTDSGTLTCTQFENETLAHPEIERRLGSVAFSSWPIERGVPPSVWPGRSPGIALMRDDGAPIARWSDLPEPMEFAAVLDRIVGAGAEIERAGDLAESGKVDEAELVSSWVAMHLGRTNEARRMLEPIAQSDSRTAEHDLAEVRLAFIDVTNGAEGAEQRLVALGESSQTPEARADAWLAIAALRLRDRDRSGRIAALRNAMDNAPKNSRQWMAARGGLSALGALDPAAEPLRIISPVEQVVSGEMTIDLDVRSDAVSSVEYFLDGRSVADVTSPPLRAKLDFGRLPEPHTVRVVGRNRAGSVVAEDSIRINDWRDRLGVTILEPEPGRRQGAVDVEIAVTVPVNQKIDRVEILNGTELVAELTSPPFRTTVNVAPSLTILSARAFLDDGSLAEDTVLLNAEGFSAETLVHLVEIPVTVSRLTNLAPEDLDLREEGVVRRVETVVDASDAPLTVGLVIDNSASMWERYLDVQAAASEFLDKVLEEGDRAFIISFDTRARLVQEPTRDIDLLKRQLRSYEPEGLTVMNDAMMLGLLQFEATPGRRALVAFSDGVDKGSRHDLDQVLDVARRSGVPVYLIRAETEELTRVPSNERFDRERYEGKLRSLIEGSGGNSYMLTGSEELLDAYREIADDIRRQLLVTYLTESEPGTVQWREIELRTRKSGVRLRAPRGVLIGTH